MSALNFQNIKMLKRQVSELTSRVEALEKLLPRQSVVKKEIELPDHLYKTYHALMGIGGKGTAQDVANRSGRARAVESAYLNSLTTLNILNKYRSDRQVIFQIRNAVNYT